MFEVLSLVGIILIAATLLQREESRKPGGDNVAADLRVTPPLKNSAGPELTVCDGGDVQSSQAVPRDARFAFVASFGVAPRELKELHIYSVAGRFDEFPKRVSELLHKMYDNGYAVGEEIMAVLHHGRPLKEGEAIYVAVAQNDRSNETRTVAFLDRRRAC